MVKISKNRRKKYLINKKFQIKLILYFEMLVIIGNIISGLLLYYFTSSESESKFFIAHMTSGNSWEVLMIQLNWFLIFAAALFSIGLYGVLARKNAIMILMGIELMLNAVNINLVAFWRYTNPAVVTGQVFAVIVFAVAAAEVAVGLALVISIFRRRDTIAADEINLMKW